MRLRCSEVCRCGYKRDEHVDLPEATEDVTDSQQSGEWSLDTQTRVELTDAFGEIQFAGSSVKHRKVGGKQ